MASISETRPTPAPHSRRGVDWVRVIVCSLALCIVAALLPPFRIWDSKAKDQRLVAKTFAIALTAALKQFSTEYGFLPTGTHAEILAALRGGNPRKIAFFDCRPSLVSPQGELLDPWKTPYYIDTSGSTRLRVYSFGKDRQDNGGAEGSDDIGIW